MTDTVFHLNLDRYSNSATVIELRFLACLTSDRTHSASARLKPGVPPMALIPRNAKVLASFDRSSGADVLAEAPDFVVLAESWATESIVTVAATSNERAREVLLDLTIALENGDAQEEDEVAMWLAKASGGGKRSTHLIPGQRWSEVERNYPSAVRSQLATLVNRKGVLPGEGRLILFYGKPGTGKTSAVRALIHEWASWCEGHLVTDPDRMFQDAEYLVNVLQSQEGRAAPTVTHFSGEPKWKLVVAEDADAYLRSTARSDAGAALGRLLNTTDGLLGQTSKTLVLLSTNEELHRLHPALIRPGRCLTRIEFVRFPQREASEWLGADGALVGTDATLAELFEAKRTGAQMRAATLRTGTYL